MPKQRPTLPLRAFVNELALAFKKLSFYPPGHPSRARAVDQALGIARSLAAPTGELALGVERDNFVAGGESLAIDSARALAQALYNRRVAVVRFLDGLVASDLQGFLLLLRTEPGADEAVDDSSLHVGLAAHKITGITIEEVDYTGVVATEDLSALVNVEVSLWQRILQLQIDGKPLGSDEDRSGNSLERVVGAMRRRFPGLFDPAHSGGVGGELGPEIDSLTGMLAEAIEAQLGEGLDGERDGFVLQQVSEFLGAIPNGLRGPLLEAALGRLTHSSTLARHVETFSASISAAELVSTLRNLRDSGRRFSPEAVAVIERLVLGGSSDSIASGSSAAAPAPTTQTGENPGRASLEALLDDPVGEEAHPLAGVDEFALKLPRCPEKKVETPPEFDAELASLEPAAIMGTLLPTLLVLLARPNLKAAEAEGVAGRLETLFDDLVRGGRLTAASALIRHLEATRRQRTDAVGAAMAASHDTLTGDRSVPLLLETFQGVRDGDLSEFKGLVDTLGQPFIRSALLSLGEEEDRRTRRELFDFLRTVVPESIVSDARALLSDPRWFVVRNMIALLGAVGDRTSLGELRRCLDHEDGRVRVEAAKTLARLDSDLSPDLVAKAIDSGDEQVAGVLVRAAGERASVASIKPLVELLQPLDPIGRHTALRVQALESLGEIGAAAILPRIRRYFRQFAPVDNAVVRRAAFRSLAGYPVAVRAPWVKKGLRSRDAEIRAVCRALARSEKNV